MLGSTAALGAEAKMSSCHLHEIEDDVAMVVILRVSSRREGETLVAIRKLPWRLGPH